MATTFAPAGAKFGLVMGTGLVQGPLFTSQKTLSTPFLSTTKAESWSLGGWCATAMPAPGGANPAAVRGTGACHGPLFTSHNTFSLPCTSTTSAVSWSFGGCRTTAIRAPGGAQFGVLSG